MAGILFWNMQTFGINKVNSTSNQVKKGQGGNTLQAAAAQRWAAINGIINAANPDIVVIVEAGTGDSFPSALATNTGGWEGAVWLMNQLRAANAAAEWRLVPPLRVGRALGSKPETVIVLFQGVAGAGQRFFSGPNRWNGGVMGQTVRPTIPGNAYPAVRNMNIMLDYPGVAARNVPAASAYNGGRAENRMAARIEFQDTTNPLYFLNFGVYRPPYMVTFCETNGAGVVQRNLAVFGIHAPAVAGNPGVFLAYVSQCHEVARGLFPNETRIIGGDFNLPLMNPDGSQSTNYQALTNNNYQLLISSPGVPPVGTLSAFKGYFATHIRPRPKSNSVGSLFLWSSPTTNSSYPGYGYIGSDQVANFYSIDNILVRPFNGGHNYQTTIMNPIVGTPFNAVAAPGGAPVGTIAMADAFQNAPMGWPPSPTAPQVGNIGNRNSLTSWNNYGYLKSVSDHFAVFADV